MAPDTKPMPLPWYEMTTPAHFWFQWRWKAFCRAAKTIGLDFSARYRALDIGCGHGLLMSQIETDTQWIATGVDIQAEAFEYASVQGDMFAYDIHDLRKDLLETFDTIFMFDILEHLKEPEAFVNAAMQYVKPKGYVCVNVPAMPFLSSRFDDEVGHLRRYTRQTLNETLTSQGLEVLDSRYWGMTCVPLLMARKLYVKLGNDTRDIVHKGIMPPSPMINSTLKAMGAAELCVLQSPPVGTSVLSIARKA